MIDARPLSRILHGIASVALIAMMLVVVADVTLRFLFNTPARRACDDGRVFAVIRDNYMVTADAVSDCLHGTLWRIDGPGRRAPPCVWDCGPAPPYD